MTLRPTIQMWVTGESDAMTVPRLPQFGQLSALTKAESAKALHVAQAVLALDAGRVGYWSHYIQEDEVWGDQRTIDLLGFAATAQPWTMADFMNVLHPDDQALISVKVADAYAGRTPFYDVEMRLVPKAQSNPSDDELWIAARGQVIERDDNGEPVHLIGVVWDISETKRSEKRLEDLAAEMDHRVKNAFAVIRALINIGANTSRTKEAFADTLRTQVEAMALGHDLAARSARTSKHPLAPVTLAEVINATLAPWTEKTSGGLSDVTINCPSDISMSPSKVSTFAMIMYELSATATKYGPLGDSGGTLLVDVAYDPDGGLQMRWIETITSPQTPRKPDRELSDILLRHCANTLNAAMTRQFTRTGTEVYLQMDHN